jgi:hypothetical protein
MDLDYDWVSLQSALAVLLRAKDLFIYLNFSLAMMIFVPYMALIVLDLVVYLWRISFAALLSRLQHLRMGTGAAAAGVKLKDS